MPSSATLNWLKGDPGEGVPAGGADEQILAKASAADYDTEWIDAPSGGGGEVTAFSNWGPLPTDDGTNVAGYSHRQICQSVLVAGNRVRVKFQGHSTQSATLDHASIGISNGTASETVAVPVELLFSSASGCTIPAGGYIWSDWAVLTIADLANLVVIYDFNGVATSKRRFNASTLYAIYYKAAAASYSTAAPAGFTATAGLWHVQAINVKTV